MPPCKHDYLVTPDFSAVLPGRLELDQPRRARALRPCGPSGTGTGRSPTPRPALLRTLLLACNRVKSKRLLLWFSVRPRHDWFTVLNIEGVNLGRSKRMIVRSGVLGREFQITVP